MRFDEDTRGQSVLIGSILLFAILIIAFSSYQAFVVPNQNAEVEFSHSQQVENEFSEFRSNVVNAIEGNDERSTSFTLGTQYPSRLIALNPPAVSGTLSTTEPGDVSLDGVNIRDVCGVDDATSRSLVYEPQYNEYQSAQSTVYEHTFVGTTFRDGQSFPQSQRLIQDDRVNLQLLTGDVSESRTGAVSIDINATHRYTHDEEITGVTIPSQFDNETWENQILSGQENIEDVEDAGDGRIEITLSEPLEVSCAVAGLNNEPEFTPPSSEPEPGEPGESVPPAYEIFWDWETMDGENEFECTADGCEIAINDRGDTAIETEPASVAGFAEFGVEDRTVGTFRDGYFVEFDNGAETVAHEFEALSVGETDIIVLAGDDRDEIEIEVYGLGTLVGTVTDAVDGSGIEGATVTVVETDQDDTTDGQGEYQIEEIRTGEYSVTVEAEGYETETATGVEINHDETTIEDFVLQSIEGFEVTITDTNSPVIEGETLTVDATVENTGEQEGTQDIELLDFDGTVVDTESVTLGGGDSTPVELGWDTEEGDAGTGDITVQSEDDSDTTEVEIEEAEEEEAERVESVPGSANVQGNNRPQFDFEVTSGDVSIERAAIETQNDFDGIGADGGGGRSFFEIDEERSSQSTDTDRNFEYEFGSLELTENDGEIFVDYRRLDTNIGNLEFADEDTDADLVIAFEFGDGSIKEFYFEEI